MLRIELAIKLVLNVLTKVFISLFMWRLIFNLSLTLTAGCIICLCISSSILISVLWYLKHFKDEQIRVLDLVCVCCLTIPFYTTNTNQFDQLIRLWQHFVDLPIGFIALCVFVHVNTLQYTLGVASITDFYVLLILSIYFVTSGITNNILIERRDLTSCSASLFSFIFRFFLFISRSLTFIMTFMAFDSLTGRLLATSCLFIEFLVFLIIYIYELIKNFDPQNDKIGKFTYFLNGLYHSWRMCIDFDETFLCNSNSKRIYTNGKVFGFTSSIVLSHLFCAYFWFYQSMLKFSSFHMNFTSDFSFVMEQNHIRFKQIILIIICGSTLLALLSFHIYYNYYFMLNHMDNSSQGSSKNENSKKARRSNELLIMSTHQQNAYYEDSHGGYFSESNSTSFSTTCSTCNQHKVDLIKKPCDYDTSSGIISTLSTSCCTYDRQFIDELSQFTNLNLNLHQRALGNRQANVSIYERVHSWFAKNNTSSLNASSITPSAFNPSSNNATLVI